MLMFLLCRRILCRWQFPFVCERKYALLIEAVRGVLPNTIVRVHARSLLRTHARRHISFFPLDMVSIPYSDDPFLSIFAVFLYSAKQLSSKKLTTYWGGGF